jgi:hypothetical protein
MIKDVVWQQAVGSPPPIRFKPTEGLAPEEKYNDPLNIWITRVFSPGEVRVTGVLK